MSCEDYIVLTQDMQIIEISVLTVSPAIASLYHYLSRALLLKKQMGRRVRGSSEWWQSRGRAESLQSGAGALVSLVGGCKYGHESRTEQSEES